MQKVRDQDGSGEEKSKKKTPFPTTNVDGGVFGGSQPSGLFPCELDEVFADTKLTNYVTLRSVR